MAYEYFHGGQKVTKGQIIGDLRISLAWLDDQDHDDLMSLGITRQAVIERQPKPPIDQRYQIASPLDDGYWQVIEREIDDGLILAAIGVVQSKALQVRELAMGSDRTVDAVKLIKQGVSQVAYADVPAQLKTFIEMEAAGYGMTGEELHAHWKTKSDQLTFAALALDGITMQGVAAINAKAAEDNAVGKDLFDVADAVDFSSITAALE